MMDIANEVAVLMFCYLSKAYMVLLFFRLRARARRALFFRNVRSIYVPQYSRMIWMKPRSQDFWESTIPKFDDADWLKHFRMRKSDFEKLVGILRHDMEPDERSVRQPIETRKRIAIGIFKLASSAEYRTVAELFGVGKSTVHNYLLLLCRSLCRRIKEFIYIPSPEEALNIAQRFKDKYHFPQVLGAIDGSHIPVVAPSRGRTDYTNRKGWDSLILQAVVDDRFCFRQISANMPGRNHDATVFKNSALFRKLHTLPKEPVTIEEVEVPLLLLGDPAYPLLQCLIKPYVGPVTPEQESFNCYHSSARIVVENAFGKLKERWRILRKIEANIDVAPTIIGACCILHNFCELANAPVPEASASRHSSGHTLEQPASRPCNFTTDGGHAVREALLKYVNSNLPPRQSMRFH